MGGKVLGLSYKLAEDVIELKVPMQFKMNGWGGPVYGKPDKCYADHGAQILAGASQLGGATGAGTGMTQWVFTATGCSWRNGA